jgi:dethiobiotin synthetase
MRQYFVTGTDTGVGKTLVTAALLELAGRRGLRSIGLKPVAAGCEAGMAGTEGWTNDDARLLQATATVPLAYAEVNPVALRRAMAPHLAAAEEGRRLAAAPLVAHCRAMAAKPHDLLLAEGAGGWLVPLNDLETLADVAAALAWPVILVVGMRLGCLNHALLTAAAIHARGLPLAGWVANSVAVEMPFLAANIATLQARLGVPLLGCVPALAAATPTAAAAHLDLAPLMD